MKNTTSRIKPGMSLFACAACALGLLLWARLLLVSHPPRVATAEPVPAAPTGHADPLHGQQDETDVEDQERKWAREHLQGYHSQRR